LELAQAGAFKNMSQDNRSHTRLLEHDRATGVRRYFHWDATTQSFTIETVRDAQDILEQNLLETNNVNTSSWKGEMHKVASLPLHIWMELREKGILQDPARMRKWLNDSANRMYRTRGGHV